MCGRSACMSASTRQGQRRPQADHGASYGVDLVWWMSDGFRGPAAKGWCRRVPDPIGVSRAVRARGDRVAAEGPNARELSESLDVSQQTLCSWRRREQIDRHERDDGVRSDEVPSWRGYAARTRGCVRSAICSSEPRPSLRRRAGPGELVPDRPGAEGPNICLRGLRPARRLNVGLLGVGVARAV
jgi:hypothetical protein